jgi:hypothetical protein
MPSNDDHDGDTKSVCNRDADDDDNDNADGGDGDGDGDGDDDTHRRCYAKRGPALQGPPPSPPPKRPRHEAHHMI